MDRLYHEIHFDTQRVSETIGDDGVHIPNKITGFYDCRGLIKGDEIAFTPLNGAWLEITKDGVVRTFRAHRGGG